MHLYGRVIENCNFILKSLKQKKFNTWTIFKFIVLFNEPDYYFNDSTWDYDVLHVRLVCKIYDTDKYD